MYTARDFSSLKGLTAISDDQIAEHLKLYNGYVTRTNKAHETLAAMLNDGKTGTPEYQEIKRRLGWETNGILLHEYYFENLTPGGSAAAGTSFEGKAAAQFGSFDAWKTDFASTAKMPGIGWVIAYLDNNTGNIVNVWITEHEMGHFAGAKPLLVLDCFEHAWTAYLKPTQKLQYLEDFFANVCFKTASKRLG
ncbi:MAG: superoxide dismutase [Deltaproteobacteria bacterium]|nr:superoxide dismutase [Deltaproteobacteria bacterium]